MSNTPFAFLFAYLLMAAGLIGSLLPLVPGPILIWLGAVVWAWADGFHRISWPLLLILGVITVFAWASDLWLTTIATRRAGGSWKAVLGAIVGGVTGGIVLTALPIVGTISGTLLGALIGILVIEYMSKRNLRQALRISLGYLLGFIVSNLVEVALCLVMLGLFAWQAFF